MSLVLLYLKYIHTAYKPMKLDDVEKNVNRSKVFAVGFILTIPATYFVWFYIFQGFGFSTDSSMWGTFGDFVGGILNPVIALLAFYWLTQSVLIQKTELKETKDALVASSVTQEKNRFESSFYSLLEQFNIVLNSLQLDTPGIRDTMKQGAIKRAHRSILNNEGITDARQAKQKLNDKFNSELGHLFRILYQLLKLIAIKCHEGDDEKINIQNFSSQLLINVPVSNDEKFYSNIVRSFLDFRVTQLLAVNCYCDSDEDSYYKYRLLIERYSFLEHMPLDGKVEQSLFSQYDKSAFGKSDFMNKTDDKEN